MANVFKKAKAYQKLHPNTDWQTCIQRVSGKGKKKVGKVKVKKSTTTVSGFRKKGPNPIEHRVNAGMTVSAAKHFIKKELDERLKRQLFIREFGATKTIKKAARKEISKLKSQLKRFS